MIEQLYGEANAGQWELPQEAFAEALRRSAEKRFRGASPGIPEIDAYLKTLYPADLALACACAAGIETAWEFFIAQFRSELRRAAASILRASGSADEARAEELADSLYAELYGLHSDGGGRRKSLFEYFHGRSKLSTWLRAVLAQRHLDMLRSGAKTVSLDAEPQGEPLKAMPHPANPVPPDPDREMYVSRLGKALCEVLAGLAARERIILACYYLDRLTLAEIGRTMREHESTVSRQLDRTRRALREGVTERLRHGAAGLDGRAAEPGLDEAQIERAFAYALEDWPFDLRRALSRENAAADPPG
ncbi:MAG: sigma-70 family RNA polymerase sigma factor [Acidobacteriia bacterium]|nr:sigma-70 family RNA polymerase sigma factor [Terriglobia bacterium]